MSEDTAIMKKKLKRPERLKDNTKHKNVKPKKTIHELNIMMVNIGYLIKMVNQLICLLLRNNYNPYNIAHLAVVLAADTATPAMKRN